MSDPMPRHLAAVSRARRPYHLTIRIPTQRENRWLGILVSFLLHAIIVVLILLPVLVASGVPLLPEGGGPGPAGGGGGGRRGSGGATIPERLQYLQVAPAAAPTVVPPVVPPVTPPPVAVPPPQPVLPEPPKVEVKPPELPPVATASAATAGTGGGTGTDGTTGNGPGSGGGIGSGIGTGRGSGVGPGTGGGAGENYAPSLLYAFIPPMPIPNKVKGTEIVATFDVDESGRVLSFKFTETKDRGYNKRLKEVFGDFRFRPAVKPDGTPIRALAQVAYTL